MPGGRRRHGESYLSPGKASMIYIVPRLSLMLRGPSILFSTGEAQSGQQSRQVIDVIGNAIVLLDQFGYAGTCPLICYETAGFRPFEQTSSQALSMATAEIGRSPGSCLCEESGFPPAIEGGTPATNATRIGLET